MSLSLLPKAAPPRPASAPPVPLVARLGASLASRSVRYCQWKGHGKRERWESGRGDIDLLIDPASWPDFIDTLAGLGFKLALPPLGREAAGVMHFYGLDDRTGRCRRLGRDGVARDDRMARHATTSTARTLVRRCAAP